MDNAWARFIALLLLSLFLVGPAAAQEVILLDAPPPGYETTVSIQAGDADVEVIVQTQPDVYPHLDHEEVDVHLLGWCKHGFAIYWYDGIIHSDGCHHAHYTQRPSHLGHVHHWHCSHWSDSYAWFYVDWRPYNYYGHVSLYVGTPPRAHYRYVSVYDPPRWSYTYHQRHRPSTYVRTTTSRGTHVQRPTTVYRTTTRTVHTTSRPTTTRTVSSTHRTSSSRPTSVHRGNTGSTRVSHQRPARPPTDQQHGGQRRSSKKKRR